jgi:methyl-branched lipid omega-hydroxylase
MRSPRAHGEREVQLAHPDFWLRPDREEIFARLRRDEPVVWQQEPVTSWSSGGRGYWAVLRHADVRELSRRPDTFISGLGTELFELSPELAEAYSWLLNMDGARHTTMRAASSGHFTARSVAALEQTIRNHAEEVMDVACEQGWCDFVKDIAEPFPLRVICDLLGVPSGDRAEVARLSRVSTPLGDAEFGTFEDALRAAFALIEYGQGLAQDRLRSPKADLMSSLVSQRPDGKRLSPAELGSYFELLVTAGTETSAIALSQGMLALIQNPDERRRWRADFDTLARSAIEEVLRWATPVMHFRRTAVANVDVHGQRILRGDKVVLFYHSANRDELVFAEPYRFDITRDPNPHLSFGGGGRHMCLGAHLARLELRVMFEVLFRRMPDLELAGRPIMAHSMFVNAVKSMPCRYTAGRPHQG